MAWDTDACMRVVIVPISLLGTWLSQVRTQVGIKGSFNWLANYKIEKNVIIWLVSLDSNMSCSLSPTCIIQWPSKTLDRLDFRLQTSDTDRIRILLISSLFLSLPSACLTTFLLSENNCSSFCLLLIIITIIWSFFILYYDHFRILNAICQSVYITYDTANKLRIK